MHQHIVPKRIGSRWLLIALVVSGTTLGLIGCGTSSRDIREVAKVQGGEEAPTVTLFGSEVTDSEVQQLTVFDNLQGLTIQECPQVSDEGLAILENLENLTVLKLIRVPVTDEVLTYLKSASSLKELQLAHTEVTGGGLKHLAGTPLEILSVHSNMATPDGLASLQELTALRDLELQCPSVTIAQLPALSPLSELKTLIAFKTPMGAEGIEKLRDLSNLGLLQVDASGVGDEGIAALNTLAALESLEFANADITNEGLKELALPKLKKMTLSGCTKITDAGLKNLEGVSAVEYLNLVDSGVDGKDLTGLAVIPSLREVVLSGNQFKGGPESIRALKELLPECEVIITQG